MGLGGGGKPRSSQDVTIDISFLVRYGLLILLKKCTIENDNREVYPQNSEEGCRQTSHVKRQDPSILVTLLHIDLRDHRICRQSQIS